MVIAKKICAIGLLSGGLDSILAVKVVQQQAVEVTGLSFVSPFFNASQARKAAEELKIPLIVQDITDDHFQIVKNPPHGYGKTMNPCIDCHALMLRIAGRLMQEYNFDFIFTGEVLGERPMSQNRNALDTVARISGYKEFVLRPLSAKLLEDTRPEKEGLVKKAELLDIQGRSRKRQILLAKEFGVTEYPNPAGGCLLTDKGFSKRLKELLANTPNPTLSEIRLLSIGRHFRLSNDSKLIVGRNKEENERLLDNFSAEGLVLTTEGIPGPWCILTGYSNKEIIKKAAQICAAYSDIENDYECVVGVRSKLGQTKVKVKVDKRNRTELRIN